MRLLLLSMSTDIVGQSAALRQALRRYRPDWIVFFGVPA